jgi:hypothetical protein
MHWTLIPIQYKIVSLVTPTRRSTTEGQHFEEMARQIYESGEACNFKTSGL